MRDILVHTLTALVDRIIPADDWPSASQNSVVPFISELLKNDLRSERQFVIDGIIALEEESKTRFSKSFAFLDAQSQDGILCDVENGRTETPWKLPSKLWFELMVRITQEGYYADRSNGANLEHISWKMVGYDPRRAI